MPSAKNNWNEIPYTSVNCCKGRFRTARKTLSTGLGVRICVQCSAGQSVKANNLSLSWINLPTALLSLSPSNVMRRSNAAAASFWVSAIPMSCRSDLALSCRDLGGAWVTFAVLCTQQRGSRVVGQTSRSTVQTPSTPSPTAKSGGGQVGAIMHNDPYLAPGPPRRDAGCRNVHLDPTYRA